MNDQPPALHGAVGRPIRPGPLVLPGARLEPRADPDRAAPLVVRIVDASPHAGLTRYEFEITGLEPGTYDLRDSLQRTDGSPTADLPPLPVTVESVLAAGVPRVHQPPPLPVTGLGGYSTAAAIALVAWLAGLAALMRPWRKRGRGAPAAASRTPADRLADLLAGARRGPLAPTERAEAERLLYDAWQRHLGLDAALPRDLVAGLRRDPGAARAIDRMADWLHAPRAPGSAELPPEEVAALVASLLPPTAPTTERAG